MELQMNGCISGGWSTAVVAWICDITRLPRRVKATAMGAESLVGEVGSGPHAGRVPF